MISKSSTAPIVAAALTLLSACGGPDTATPPVETAAVAASAGSSPTTDEADDEPVRWIAGHQSGDGRWEAAGWDRWRMGVRVSGERLPGIGSPSLDVAVTSLALMAYAGAGYTPVTEGPGGAVVAWALHALVGLQNADGAFGDPKDASWPVNQGLAILALTEQAEMHPDARLVAAVQRGVRRFHRSRAVEAERWISDHVFGGLPAFAWVALASQLSVQAAKSAQPEGEGTSATGLESDRRLANDRAAVAAWITLPDAERTLAKVGAALTIDDHDRLGRKDWQGLPALVAAANWLTDRSPVWNATGRGVDAMGWWLGTRGVFAVGGEPWKRWEHAMKSAIIDTQRKDGSFCELKGSWDPVGKDADEGGRVFVTLACSLSLEIWYRYDKVLGISESPSPTQERAVPTPKPIPEGPPLPKRHYLPCK